MTLGELLALYGGSIKTGPFGTTLKAAEYSSSGVPLISVGEVGEGVIRVHSKTPRVDTGVVSRLPEYVLRSGDVVFCRKGAIDRSAWIRPHEDGYFLGSDGIRVRFGEGVSSRFMAFQFRLVDVRQWLIRQASGSTMASMNQRTLEQLPILVPPLATQQGIAELLGALDDKIAANDALLRLADELCGAEVAKASAGGEISRLGALITLHYGKALPATQRHPGDVVVYGSGGPTGWHSTPLVPHPGIVVGRKGTVGTVYWADGPHFPIDTTFYVEPLQPGTDEVLYYLMHTMSLDDLNSDSAVPGLNRDEAYAQEVRVPPAEVRAALSGKLRARFVWMRAVRQESRKLAAARDELLPLLMSGRVRVREAEKVVEAVV